MQEQTFAVRVAVILENSAGVTFLFLADEVSRSD